MENGARLYYNDKWDSCCSPLVSVVVCLFNRRDTVLRALQSVENQTFKNLELIVVDNGSTIPVEDIVIGYLMTLTIPSLFIKRDYGMGPMTGRNSGIEAARGEYIAILDDDDEYLPDAIETLITAWDCIPDSVRHEYREVVALCQDQNGRLIGDKFPANINNVPWKNALELCNKAGSAHIALNRSDILKKHPFPEPEGVTMASESLIWEMLSEKYKSWYVNEVVYTYYLNSTDSYCKTAKKRNPVQIAINGLFNAKYRLENKAAFNLSMRKLMMYFFYYNLYWIVIMRLTNEKPSYEWAQSHPKGVSNSIIRTVTYLPAWGASFVYINRLH